MLQFSRKPFEHVHIRAALHVEHMAGFPRSHIMLRAEVLQRVTNVLLLRQIVCFAVEDQRQVRVQRLAQHHLRVRHHHHLTIVLVRDVPEKDENLPLPENFQVRIRLVDQQDACAGTEKR